jgi:hypothetical protein
LASEALALARRVGAAALIASSLLAVGVAVADTDPDRSRACLRESRELSAELGYESAIDLVRATAIVSRLNDGPATLELGREAIRGLRWGGDRRRMGLVFHMIAGALAATRPAAAAIIHGAAETVVVGPPNLARLIGSVVPGALGEERARELRARGAAQDWDAAVAYTLSEATDALTNLEPERRP